jgi:uncharacterized protein
MNIQKTPEHFLTADFATEQRNQAFIGLQHVVYERMKHMPQCHGWDHTIRVCLNARKLAQHEGNVNPEVVDYAAMLHDIGRVEEFRTKGIACHATTGAEESISILKNLGMTNDTFINHVADCIRTHRYRRRNEVQPQTLEAKIIFDADKLDSMGAIGIGRAFHFAGRVGARVHNTKEEAETAEEYSINDTAYREYLVKLRHLKESVLTESGAQMAEARHDFMERFFQEIKLETT